MCVGFSVWLGWSGIHVAGASACNTDTTPTQPHQNSNPHRTKNNTTNGVKQQNSRKLLVMAILMSETCWAHKKWNKIKRDIKLFFYSSTVSWLNTIRFLFMILDEERSLQKKDGYSRRIAGYHFGCCWLRKETWRSTETNSTWYSHTSCEVHWVWRWDFGNIYCEPLQICHLL